MAKAGRIDMSGDAGTKAQKKKTKKPLTQKQKEKALKRIAAGVRHLSSLVTMPLVTGHLRKKSLKRIAAGDVRLAVRILDVRRTPTAVLLTSCAQSRLALHMLYGSCIGTPNNIATGACLLSPRGQHRQSIGVYVMAAWCLGPPHTLLDVLHPHCRLPRLLKKEKK